MVQRICFDAICGFCCKNEQQCLSSTDKNGSLTSTRQEEKMLESFKKCISGFGNKKAHTRSIV